MALVAGALIAVYSDSDQRKAAAVEPPAVSRRRSASYEPSSWDYDSICSLGRPLREEADGDVEGHQAEQLMPESVQATILKDRVRRLLLNEDDDDQLPATSTLRIIHQLQSLGVAYHFEEIKGILISMHHGPKDDLDLSSAALLFRMLRGQGIPASTDMLSAFRDDSKQGGFVRSKCDSDGLLALYEASFLAFPGETVLEEARAFAVENLARVENYDMQVPPPSLIGHGGHPLPLHWRAPRLQAMWSLRERCSDDSRVAPAIVQLARVDFNLVQALHREELAEIAKWWKESGLGEKQVEFARDRVVECFFCAACIAPEPHLGDCREVLAKTGSLIVHLDDIYDVYGTLDELQAFTDAIGQFELIDMAAAPAALPEYMKVMYSAIWETSVTAADRVLKKQGYDVLPLYKKAWHELCKAFLVEARWQHQGYMPSFGEYVSNGWVTSTGPLLLLHALPTTIITQHQQQQTPIMPYSGSSSRNGAIDYPRLVELSSTIFRLCNDCATHKAESERGDAPSSIACCMAEMCAIEEQARAAVQGVITETWKVLNKEVVVSAAGGWDWNPCYARSMANLCLNLARTIHCIYQDGDGITSPNHRMKHLVKDFLFNPIL